MAETERPWQRLGSLAALFLRLGIIGFGGPLAHIGLMEDEFATRRRWVTHEDFLEGLAICNLLPGPTSTQLSIYLGYLRTGPLGGIISGACFIAPAFVLVLILAWVYIQYAVIPAVGALFVGIGPVVIAIIFNTLYRSSRTALTSVSSWCLSIAVCILTLLRLLPPSINLVFILLASGVVGILVYGHTPAPPASELDQQQEKQESRRNTTPKSLLFVPFLVSKISLLIPLALVFLKIGLLMFGGGLLVATLLQQELVDGLHWLTTRQLLDGLALGQLTPGPVSVVATFVGYTVAGPPGAVVATVAVFLPSFVLVLSLTPLLRRIRNLPWAKGFLKGITAGALGAIAAAGISLGLVAIVDVITAAIALISLLLLIRWNINTFFLIAGAAVIGLLRSLL